MSYRSLLLLALLGMMAACGRSPETSTAREHDDGDEHAAEAASIGPHGGRLLKQDGYAVELKIFEDGVPPHYRAWFYRANAPLPPTAGSLSVTLTRLGGATETHTFAVEGDDLVGRGEVAEPHSFDVDVQATLNGKTLRWTYPSYEGRTTIPAKIADQAGVRTAHVGPGSIRDEHDVQGLITPIEGRRARIMARFPGPVRAVNVGVGDSVRAGQTLATIESNISLSSYAVTSPLTGTVLERNVSIGDLAGDTPLFEVADLSKLWVDLHLFGADAQHITPGLPVEIVRLSDGVAALTKLDRVLPGTATASQSTVARATVDNADGRWRIGAAVRARVTVSTDPVDLLVPLSALQTFRDGDVVFVRVGDAYEARPLTHGRRDGVNVEVLDGLSPGDEIVVEQSYLIKADIEKSGASHDH
jgi:cobalt-zinc-cadmium efflux system membrane fusion protein